MQLLAFKDFTADSGSKLTMHKIKGYCHVNSLPYCQLNIDFATMDEYLSRLHSDMSRYLRRVERKAKELEVMRTQDPEPWLDTIYAWYVEQVKRSETSFGVHSRDYFENVCRVVPGAEYVLYFAPAEADGAKQLIGFELLVRQDRCLVQKYIGMHETLGKQYKFFFVSWLENIRSSKS